MTETNQPALDFSQTVGLIMRDLLQVIDEIGFSDSVHRVETDSVCSLSMITVECWYGDLTLEHIVNWCDRIGADTATINVVGSTYEITATTTSTEMAVRAKFFTAISVLVAAFPELTDVDESLSVDRLRELAEQDGAS